jgi:hypothetical protein
MNRPLVGPPTLSNRARLIFRGLCATFGPLAITCRMSRWLGQARFGSAKQVSLAPNWHQSS